MADRRDDLAGVVDEVGVLREALAAAELSWAAQIHRVDGSNTASAVNLVHYLALRQCDLRGLQRRLAMFGLSSLGRTEAHVQASLDAIAMAAAALFDRPPRAGDAPQEPAVDFADGVRLLRRHTTALLGPEPDGRQTRIMVTLPSEAASDPGLVRTLVEHGMDLARVNCAHDDPDAWAAMITHVRQASAAVRRPCRIAMDLAGPKLRTGPLADGPRVVRLRPTRNALGRVTTPAWCWLTTVDNPSPPPRPDLPVLPVPGAWLARLRTGVEITFTDTRDAARRLLVSSAGAAGTGVLASTGRTAYVATGTVLHTSGAAGVPVGPIPPLPQFLTLRRGDTLVLTRDCAPAPVPPPGEPRIGCTLPEAFGHVRVGQPVYFDDGKISAVVTAADAEEIRVRITATGNGGSRLRAGKGINLPDTALPVSALTGTDREHLRFVSEHADLVELSFVRGPNDIADLLSALDDLADDRLGVVVKIETAQAFQNLPGILLAAMRRPHTGVMIARGDLAVECGYERLAELQEEILWLCEAAHVPVTWATQVLDRLARTGQPSRAEITDAAMGVRAECVMLNKGPHIVDAVITLDDILRRMAAHHNKKTALMRPLRSWRRARIPGPR